jgi:type IV pilus assembly protein PilM
MGSIHKTPHFFHDKPLFGFDIGQGSLKVVQLSYDNLNKPRLNAYGSTTFDRTVIQEGVITEPEAIAKAAQSLIKHGLIGDLTSRRVAFAIPSYRTFTRSVKLPKLKQQELAEAVRLEAEQYVPGEIDDMYLDYTVLNLTEDTTEVLIVAVSKAIVDSYVELGCLMGLESVMIEPTMNANGRIFARDAQSDVPSAIIDFGTMSADISIYDNGIVTTGTVEAGGQLFTEAIQKSLGVSQAEAAIIKAKYGLSKSRRQDEIRKALEPTLHKIVTEIKRLVRYYHEYSGKDMTIQQVITLGGGANIPGLNDYLTNDLRMAVRTLDPWQNIDTGRLQPPTMLDHPIFTSAIGLSLIPPEKVFK